MQEIDTAGAFEALKTFPGLGSSPVAIRFTHTRMRSQPAWNVLKGRSELLTEMVQGTHIVTTAPG